MPLVWAHALQHCFTDPDSAPAVQAFQKAHVALLPTREQERDLTLAIANARAMELPRTQRHAALCAIMQPLFEDVRAFRDNDWQFFANLLRSDLF